MTLNIQFDNSYRGMPDRFYALTDPTPVHNPGLIAVNERLAAELGLDVQELRSADGIDALSGNAVPVGAEPLAQVYAGHQFGGWSPQLGDGRAVLLGEVLDYNGLRRDIQLKGSGPTQYSRRGDGRAWLGPVLREYIVSEAMHALGIPTTRALAATTTGQMVQRERSLPGAVLTRIASSHIRVGTFQYFAARKDFDALGILTKYVIDRHFPEAETPLEMLDAVIDKQAKLIAKWMGVGFIHGVMNTDNSHVGGETIDYGPCAFMDEYQSDKVFSSIDQMGRYAYDRQPDMAVWNMAQLATSLLPLIDDDMDKAVERATRSVHRFPDIYSAAWLDEFRAKLGLATAEDGDRDLIAGLMTEMAKNAADFTNTFRGLHTNTAREGFADPITFDHWAEAWTARRAREGTTSDQQIALMRSRNPAVIPRNHRIEEMIQSALSDDYDPFFMLGEVLQNPYELSDANQRYALPPMPDQAVTQTFCGT